MKKNFNKSLSLITVCFNAENTIEQTIQSVISQEYFSDIEYIIIDGGSTDNTLNIINNYKDNIDIFITEKDNGTYDAMNKGITYSNCEIIGFLNADDIFYDKKITKLVIDTFNNNNIDLVYGDLIYINPLDINSYVRNWRSHKYHDKYFEYGNVPAHPSLYVKKIVYKKAGLFNTVYKLASDYDLMIRFFKIYNFRSLYLDHYLVKMRLGGATSKNLLNRLKQNIEIYTIWKNNNLVIPFYFFPCRFMIKIKQYFFMKI